MKEIEITPSMKIIAEEILPIIQAVIDGRKVEFNPHRCSNPPELDNFLKTVSPGQYRIIPKYRPFRTVKEAQVLLGQQLKSIAPDNEHIFVVTDIHINSLNGSLVIQGSNSVNVFKNYEYAAPSKKDIPVGIEE